MTPFEKLGYHRFRRSFPVWGRLIPRRVVMWLIVTTGVEAAKHAAEHEAAKHACVVCGNPCASMWQIGCVPGDCAFKQKD